MAYLSTLPTAFERQVRKLGLDERTCVASKVLRLWCEENKDRSYIPEWLLARWGMTVNPSLAPERNDFVAQPWYVGNSIRSPQGSPLLKAGS
jgi:hypothetical protein